MQSNYKLVQEVPFVESVHNVISNYKSSSKHTKSRRKIFAKSSPSKPNLEAELAQSNVA